MIFYIVGNWKMYKTGMQAAQYLEELLPLVEDIDRSRARLMLAVPYTAIQSAVRFAEERVAIGAQNMHDATEGAFTGEIAAEMLKEAGASFVLLGHSERRRLFHETDAFIHRKVVAALFAGLTPLLCVGETAEEREAGREREVLEKQIFAGLEGISLQRADQLVIAYEPVWAIGTGRAATPAIVGEMHRHLRALLCTRFGEALGSQISILYGGSVQLQNVAELMGEAEVGGLLIGGASLSPETFAAIAHQSIERTSP
ncbi:MAG: triose-phosphate isomerase [Verrucomicrobiota bacterium]|nr:triose-phosphate isomerase [Verrucomicrobiota bacterium]